MPSVWMFIHCACLAGRPSAHAAFSAWIAAEHCADGVNFVNVGVVVDEAAAGAHAVRAAVKRPVMVARSVASVSGSPAVGLLRIAIRSELSSAASARTQSLIALMAAVHSALGVNVVNAGWSTRLVGAAAVAGWADTASASATPMPAAAPV